MNPLIKEKIRTIPNYPKSGILFRDITTLLKDAVGFRLVIDDFRARYAEHVQKIDLVVGIEARGFVIGGALAYALGKGFIPIRKSGKLPAKVMSIDYNLEYGIDRMEIHEDAIWKGCRVLLVDDLLATGGTALASAELIEKLGGQVHEIAFIVNLPDLGGQQKLTERNYRIFYLAEFEGE